MKLGFLLGYSGKQINIPMDLIKHAESLGFDSVWTAEAYGNDAVTAASWVLAQTEKGLFDTDDSKDEDLEALYDN